MDFRRIEDRVGPVFRRQDVPGTEPGMDPRDTTEPIADQVRVPALERALLLAHIFAREDTPDGVWSALGRHAAAVTRGWAAACMVTERNGLLRYHRGDGADSAATPFAPRFVPQDQRVNLRAAEFGGPFTTTLLARESRGVQELVFRPLEWLFDDMRVKRAACINVGQRGILAIVERRAHRAFEPDDWYRLRAIAEQADVTLQRIELASARRARRQAP